MWNVGLFPEPVDETIKKSLPDLLVHIANINNRIILNVHYNIYIVSGVHQTMLSFIPSDSLNGLFIYAQ